jgi:DMSO/TMAO reductase YedYZ molybdopterin-dependent catalytic subunit
MGPVAGVVTAAVAAGVGHLVAGVTIPQASPVVVVGQAVIGLTPAPIKTWAEATFGPHDKTVLVAGVVVLLFAFAALIGWLTFRYGMRFGYAGLAVFGAIGLMAGLTRPSASPSYATPTLIAVAAGALILRWLVRLATPRAPDNSRIVFGGPGPQPVRREFLAGSAAALGGAALAALAGRELATRTTVSNALTHIKFPRPAVTARPLPAGTQLNVPGITAFITPDDAFYRVDTAIVLPQVDPSTWQLRIHGMVRRELVLSYDDLLRRPLIEDWITLCCVSNPVGGPYIGNAKWLGASLASLLREAGLMPGAQQLLCTSTDGYTSGTPVPIVMDGRDSLLAVAMNGQALPVEHGFPVRLVTPGLYGYVSACKWITDINVTTWSADAGYWVTEGWSQQAPIKTESRIDVPTGSGSPKAGPLTVAGVAWAQHKGIEAVEVQIDSGPWNEATLASVPGIDTWRQWQWNWDATAGSHLISARATDATGYTQTSAIASVTPNGATGYPQVQLTIA